MIEILLSLFRHDYAATLLPCLTSLGHLTAGMWFAFARPNAQLRLALRIPAER